MVSDAPVAPSVGPFDPCIRLAIERGRAFLSPSDIHAVRMPLDIQAILPKRIHPQACSSIYAFTANVSLQNLS